LDAVIIDKVHHKEKLDADLILWWKSAANTRTMLKCKGGQMNGINNAFIY
jgi:hypothetical protein